MRPRAFGKPSRLVIYRVPVGAFTAVDTVMVLVREVIAWQLCVFSSRFGIDVSVILGRDYPVLEFFPHTITYMRSVVMNAIERVMDLEFRTLLDSDGILAVGTKFFLAVFGILARRARGVTDMFIVYLPTTGQLLLLEERIFRVILLRMAHVALDIKGISVPNTLCPRRE